MIVHAGFQTFEFLLPPVDLEDRETLYFTSSEDALKWLKRLGFLHSNLIVRLRDYVARHCDDPETFRVTHYNSLERLANLLYLRRIVVSYVEDRACAGSPTPTTAGPPACLSPVPTITARGISLQCAHAAGFPHLRS